MTKEEAINQLQDAKDGYKEYLSDEAISITIKALEQEPCEDCVSRTDVLKLMCEKCPVYNCITGCQSYRSIEKMPSVTLKAESEG